MRIVAFVLVPGLTFAACDGSTEPGEQPPSTLEFTYSGTRSGTYSVQGDIPADPGDGSVFTTEWATGQRFFGGQEYIFLLGDRPRPAGTWDGVQILIPASGTGTYSLDGASGVVFDYDDPQDPYFFIDGRVEVTLLEGDRISGTFSGTLEGNDGHTLEITGGRFDVCVQHDGDQGPCGG